ncbi:hypothetical protein JTB14_008203 [Gonioctena quinquepunctata]|nr:hypothetical protein JTB14_008203 [Gonioctena quinquepunctata]
MCGKYGGIHKKKNRTYTEIEDKCLGIALSCLIYPIGTCLVTRSHRKMKQAHTREATNITRTERIRRAIKKSHPYECVANTVGFLKKE